MVDINFCSHFSVNSHVILIKSAIYFRVIEKDFDFLASGGYVVKYGSIVSKVFDIFFCNNKNQVMIIKLLKL